MTEASDRPADFVEALAKGIAILESFDAAHPEMTLSDVARKTGVTPAAARRSLITLSALGYVGQTGLASGPHCDYRIMIDGSWVNPLTVEFPPATSVPGEQMDQFTSRRDQLLARLDEDTTP